jgi:type II secretory pathway pseudopilin PulG
VIPWAILAALAALAAWGWRKERAERKEQEARATVYRARLRAQLNRTGPRVPGDIEPKITEYDDDLDNCA